MGEIVEDLKTLLLNFEEIISAHLPNYIGGGPVTNTIREIYATRTASVLLSTVLQMFSDTTKTGLPVVSSPGLRPPLPSLEDFRAAAPSLVEAVTSRDQTAAIQALERMGVLALCPSCDQDFSRLEYSVGSIVGRVRLIPLVELAKLAATLNYFENASRYVAEAHSLSPGPAQLHHLHTVTGLVALSRGSLASATEYLAASVRVCRKNDWACLDCAVSEQDLTLADRLLDHGQYPAVISFLAECLNVWKHSRGRMCDWIDELRAGRRPDLSAPPLMFFKGAALRMREQALLGDVFKGMSPEAIEEHFGTLEEFCRRNDEQVRRAIKGKLDSGRS